MLAVIEVNGKEYKTPPNITDLFVRLPQMPKGKARKQAKIGVDAETHGELTSIADGKEMTQSAFMHHLFTRIPDVAGKVRNYRKIRMTVDGIPSVIELSVVPTQEYQVERLAESVGLPAKLLWTQYHAYVRGTTRYHQIVNPELEKWEVKLESQRKGCKDFQTSLVSPEQSLTEVDFSLMSPMEYFRSGYGLTAIKKMQKKAAKVKSK